MQTEAIVKTIHAHVVHKTAPDGGDYQSLPLEAEQKIAGEYQTSQREVQKIALQNAIIPERYQRNLGTTGIVGQIKLLDAKVAVIGAGGLGGSIIELLARMGVGQITVCDGDTFSENNLNRQLIATESVLGCSKAMMAKDRVNKINSAVEVIVVDDYITQGNITTVLDNVDIVVDALDNAQTRFIVADAAQELKIPFIHGAIGGFCGHVTTIMPGDQTLELIYGEREKAADQGVEIKLGNPAATPLMIAALEVQETVKLITGTGNLLQKRLLYLDAERGVTQVIDLQ